MTKSKWIGITLIPILFIALPTNSATKNEFYEDALSRMAEPDLQGAVIQLKNALQLDPEFLSAWIKLADAYLATGFGAAAEIAIKKAQMLGAHPKLTLPRLAKAWLFQAKIDEILSLKIPNNLPPREHAEVLVAQGNALLENNRYQDAESKYSQAKQLDMENPGHYLGRAMVRLRTGAPQSGLQFTDEAIALDQNYAESWYVRGELNRNLGDTNAALSNFSKAIRLKALHLPARIGRAAIYSAQNELHKAKSDLDIVLENDPKNLQGLYLNGVVHIRLGDTEQGNRLLDAATELIDGLSDEFSSGHLASQLIVATLHVRSNNFERAIKPLEQFLAQSRAHKPARKMLAQCYLAVEYASAARKVLLDLAQDYPDDANVHWLLGELYSQLGNDDKAVEAFEKARNLGYDAPNAKTRIGVALMKGGDITGAATAFESASQADGSNPKPKLMQYYLHLSRSDPTAALEVAESLLALDASNAIYHNLAASAKLILGRRKEAREQFGTAISLDPEFVTPRVNLAEMSRQEGDLQAAENQYQQLIENFGLEIEMARGMAEIAMQRKQPEAAIQWLEKIRSLDAKSIGDRLNLVRTYLLVNEFDPAFAELKTLFADNPDNIDIVLTQAVVNHNAGNLSATEDDLARATGMALGDAEKLSNLIKTQTALGYSSAAIRNYNRMRALVSDHKNIDINIAKLQLRRGDTNAAMAIAERLIENYSAQPVGYLLRGRAHLQNQQPNEAVASFEKVLELTEGRVGQVELARAHMAAGRAHEAISLVKSRLEKQPKNVSIRLVLADFLQRNGQPLDAITEYEKIISLEGDNFPANNNLALLLFKMSDSRAVIQAERALSLQPKSPAALDTAGWILLQSGQKERALDYLREAYARDAATPEIKFHLAQALMTLGVEIEQARALLREVANEASGDLGRQAASLLAQIAKI